MLLQCENAEDQILAPGAGHIIFAMPVDLEISHNIRLSGWGLAKAPRFVEKLSLLYQGSIAMKTLNQLFLLGYVGSEPKAFGDTCKLSISTNNVWYDAKKEKHEETEWTPVTVLNATAAKWIVDNIKTGDTVHVTARVKQNSYEKDGKKIFSTDVIAESVDLVSRKSDRSA
jgi:single-strand DNA-binding protein